MFSRLLHGSREREVLLQRHSHRPQEHEDRSSALKVQHRHSSGGLGRVSARRSRETHGRGQTHSRSSGRLQHRPAHGGRRHRLHRPRHGQTGVLLRAVNHIQRDAALPDRLIGRRRI